MSVAREICENNGSFVLYRLHIQMIYGMEHWKHWQFYGNYKEVYGRIIIIFEIFDFVYEFIGYEVEGLEHIPASGPVLIVFYHGALPIDFYYLFAKIWLYRNRRVRVVADRFVFKIPGMIFDYSYKIYWKWFVKRSWYSTRSIGNSTIYISHV